MHCLVIDQQVDIVIIKTGLLTEMASLDTPTNGHVDGGSQEGESFTDCRKRITIERYQKDQKFSTVQIWTYTREC